MVISVIAAAIWQFTDMSYKLTWTTTGIVAVVASFIPFFVISLIENAKKPKAGEPMQEIV